MWSKKVYLRFLKAVDFAVDVVVNVVVNVVDVVLLVVTGHMASSCGQ